MSHNGSQQPPYNNSAPVWDYRYPSEQPPSTSTESWIPAWISNDPSAQPTSKPMYAGGPRDPLDYGSGQALQPGESSTRGTLQYQGQGQMGTSQMPPQISQMQGASTNHGYTHSPVLAVKTSPQFDETHQPPTSAVSAAAEDKPDGDVPAAKKSRKRKKKPEEEESAKKNKLEQEEKADKKKEEAARKEAARQKTGRACDACRSKKTRCDILPDPSAMGQPICKNCSRNELECTFFLPITETRFKKKAIQPTAESIPDQAVSPTVTNTIRHVSSGHSPNYEIVHEPRNREVASRVEGPTSISFLIHTSVPPIQSEAYDLRHHNSWEVLEDGNGFIRVNAPPTATGYADADPQDPSKAHNRLNKPVLSAQTMSLLVNAYFNEVAPLLPIISRAEFAAKSNPPPLLLYSICGMGATRRQFPKEIYTGVRGVINGILRSNDILSDARLENVQALLLLSQVHDVHAQPSAPTASASSIRTNVAIRMAQELGLHRELSHGTENTQDLELVELRRRVWAACVIMDRWNGVALGAPLTIDLADCDVLLPMAYTIDADQDVSAWQVNEEYVGLAQHLKLSILLGRVLKTIYSPTGLKHATDDKLQKLTKDINDWIINLPDALKFTGPDSSRIAGLLHMSFATVQFLFWRVFMRIEYHCPPQISFGLDVQQWSKIIEWSREALEWLDKHDDALDTVFTYSYAATNCALIQYHTWARRGDQAALGTLRLVKETATRWEAVVQPDQMSLRRKNCETLALLYEAALKTNPSGKDSLAILNPNSVGNPTAGVSLRTEPAKVVFVKDSSRPGGGFYVARDEQEKKASGLTENIMLESEYKEERLGDVITTESVRSLHSRGGGSGQDKPVESFTGQSVHSNGSVQGSTPMSMPVMQPPQEMMPPQAHQQPVDDMGKMLGMHHAPFQDMQNVNPNLGFGEHGQVDFGYQQIANPASAARTRNDNTLEANILDSLPVSTFDWDSWQSYFDRYLPPGVAPPPGPVAQMPQPPLNGGMNGGQYQSM
ncbi:hypothetical protein L202_01126 [Cryptococcus amylolentus CBS 6039]|uniref:Zn(2)-C6 fungal-type domain-containing protein n=1 Tax=Cryptococcus amylolentus CBS 6039 TaxID=1295533 RepID=A0A1E3I4Y2_9TREE|nr:hypothetical protein L202_01126 [Cryptococcus amylolentus CBS 6039]ODN82866.1 hypothetical protein L202_01126 [Cryptococcus amylolentus CBS 6039]